MVAFKFTFKIFIDAGASYEIINFKVTEDRLPST